MATGSRVDMGNWVKHIFHENEMELKISAAAIIVAVVLWQIKRFSGSKSRPKLPPGPLNLPIVGAMFSLEADIYGWYRKMVDKYGKIFYFRVGSHGILVVCSVEGAEEVLKTKDAIFANRPNQSFTKSAAKYVGFDAEDIVFGNFTDEQKNLKKLLINNLLTTSQLSRFEDLRRREGAFLVENIRNQINSEGIIKVGTSLMDHALNVISLLFSRRRYTDALTSESDELKRCNDIARTFTDLFFQMNLGDLFPWLAWADFQGLNKQFQEFNQLCRKVIGQIVEEHKEARTRNKNSADADIVDILLTHHEKGELTENAVLGCLSDLIAGGTETHSKITEWALLELAKNPGEGEFRLFSRNPDCLAKLQKELDEAIGKDRPVEESDFPNLPYLQAVVHETFRFHGSAPSVVHFNLQATTVQGFHVPANTTVFVNSRLITQDPLYWKDPEKFDPERFMNREKIDLKGGQVFSLAPFSSGRRKCPGATLGLLLMQRNLCTLVHAFDWSPPPGKTKDDIDNTENLNDITRPKTPLVLSAKLRLDPAVYTQLIR